MHVYVHVCHMCLVVHVGEVHVDHHLDLDNPGPCAYS